MDINHVVIPDAVLVGVPQMAARQRIFTLGSKSQGYNRYGKYILQNSDFQVKNDALNRLPETSLELKHTNIKFWVLISSCLIVRWYKKLVT